MTKDRAILMVRKLRSLADGAGTESEAENARRQAEKLQARFKIDDHDLAESVRSSNAAPISDDETTTFLRDFERSLRVDLLVAGRKEGRFADHPHVQRIVAARQRKAAQS